MQPLTATPSSRRCPALCRLASSRTATASSQSVHQSVPRITFLIQIRLLSDCPSYKRSHVRRSGKSETAVFQKISTSPHHRGSRIVPAAWARTPEHSDFPKRLRIFKKTIYSRPAHFRIARFTFRIRDGSPEISDKQSRIRRPESARQSATHSGTSES